MITRLKIYQIIFGHIATEDITMKTTLDKFPTFWIITHSNTSQQLDSQHDEIGNVKNDLLISGLITKQRNLFLFTRIFVMWYATSRFNQIYVVLPRYNYTHTYKN